MAKDKKSFVVYTNWKSTFEKLSDDEAGKLIKHIFRYVTDENPIAPDRITELVFEPLKQILKTDLAKYEEIRQKRSEAGKKGGAPVGNTNASKDNQLVEENDENNQKQPKQPKTTNCLKNQTKQPDTVTVTDTVTDTVLSKDNDIYTPTASHNGADWKKDFNVYLSDLRTAFRDVQKNDKWLKQQQSFYPKVDIIKSIEKSCVNFWGTEAGWKHKKKSRYKSVDWNSTFANSISQNQNKVYKTAYDEQQDNVFTY